MEENVTLVYSPPTVQMFQNEIPISATEVRRSMKAYDAFQHYTSVWQRNLAGSYGSHRSQFGTPKVVPKFNV